jgi:hypothetical protein
MDMFPSPTYGGQSLPGAGLGRRRSAKGHSCLQNLDVWVGVSTSVHVRIFTVWAELGIGERVLTYGLGQLPFGAMFPHENLRSPRFINSNLTFQVIAKGSFHKRGYKIFYFFLFCYLIHNFEIARHVMYEPPFAFLSKILISPL